MWELTTGLSQALDWDFRKARFCAARACGVSAVCGQGTEVALCVDDDDDDDTCFFLSRTDDDLDLGFLGLSEAGPSEGLGVSENLVDSVCSVLALGRAALDLPL